MTQQLLAHDEELTGEVLGVLYADRDSGFGVVELSADSAAGGARCSGPLADLVEGQTVRLVGRWTAHARYGPTFAATFYEQVTPTTEAGLVAFLHSERFADLGPEVVTRVVTALGADAGRVIEHEPERLATATGLSEDVARELHDRWVAGLVLARLVRLVEPIRLPLDVVRAIHARFGEDSVTVARDDPYTLLEVDRVRFSHADQLALHLGVEPLDPRRLAAGARAAVAAARRQDGHQHLPRSACAQAAARLLRVDVVAAAGGVEAAIAAGTLAADRVGDPPEEVVSTTAGLRAERDLAADLHRVTSTRPRLAHLTGEAPGSEELTDGQRVAVDLALRHPLAVLTGGPGTGKTRTVQEIVRAVEAGGGTVALCAPTGRAAKRLEELVGRPASTIHRLLEARPLPGGGFTFRYGTEERLPFDLVVCDEVSMCDTALARSLAAATETGSHLLLVGDPDQLPSVGPGDVLRDVLASEVVPSVRLTEVHRQAAASRIVTLAHEVNTGTVGRLAPVDGDVFLAEEPRRDVIVARVVAAVAERAPDYLGVTVDDVQVVAPIYRGPVGVDALNRALKRALNPGDGRRDVAGFHDGDRVMQTRNDPDRDVSNGDIGTVVDVDPGAKRLRVAFPRGEVTYDREQARDLVTAWAVTVHKSQGGEWPVVVLVCDRSHRSMLWRNLAYTAITRAQRALIVVGQAEALRAAAAQDRPRDRRTALAWRLRQHATGAA